jgi:hypothetical protein
MSSSVMPPQNVIQTPVIQVVPEEEKRLLAEWSAPSRPFKKRDKDYFTTVTTMAILFIVILFFLKEFLVILVVIAIVFLTYALSTIPPENIDNAIYTTGLKNGKHFYSWLDLQYYWFENKWGNNPMLVARTRAALPGAVYMLMGTVSREKIEEAIGTRLSFNQSMDNSWMDRASGWLSRVVPLEKKQV